jgi:hypothetical protein
MWDLKMSSQSICRQIDVVAVPKQKYSKYNEMLPNRFNFNANGVMVNREINLHAGETDYEGSNAFYRYRQHLPERLGTSFPIT